MSTNSAIAMINDNEEVTAVYCHWDGYPQHVGNLLFNNYNTNEKVEALIDLGNISSLDESIECPEGHDFDNRAEGCTTFYGRDRGEENQEANIFDTLDDFVKGYKDNSYCEYLYVFAQGKWNCFDVSKNDWIILDKNNTK